MALHACLSGLLRLDIQCLRRACTRDVHGSQQACAALQEASIYRVYELLETSAHHLILICSAL